MNQLIKSFKTAQEIFPNAEEINLELLYAFSTEETARDYYSHVYHPEHANSMVDIHKEGQLFVCGFNSSFDFDFEHLKVIEKTYNSIALEYGGTLYKLRLRKHV